MQKITPFLWFDNQAEEAVDLYVSIFKNSRIDSITRYGPGGPGPEGSVMTIAFQLDGQDFVALNGGPVFTFTPAISFYVSCRSQEEVDDLWEKLSTGGAEEQCGWLKDRFGVSWQVVPKQIGDYLGGPDPEGAARANAAMLQMQRLDVEALRLAYEGVGA
jgi:predicted 3-demethylubiquinone-9 3-methyltransferase (glyoxalase superfamily)